MRTYCSLVVKDALPPEYSNIRGFDPFDWLGNDDNVALTNENGDVALFERQYSKVVAGHYFFHSRGKEARKVAREFLEELFEGPFNVETVVGLTPVDHLGALQMNKYLGFTEQDTVEIESGKLYKFVTLTKEEWESKQ